MNIVHLSSIYVYLGCFHILAIINNAAVSIGVYIAFQVFVFRFYHYLFIYFWLWLMACRSLVPRPGIETQVLSSESAESKSWDCQRIAFFFFLVKSGWMVHFLNPHISGSVFLLLLHI